MNAFLLLPLQESMAQPSAGKHDQWEGYMTIVVINVGIIKSISILTGVIGLMVKFHADILQDCFCQEVQWTLAIR
jgi:riboflavin transporter FmnP